jgi:hypothetical protein
MAGRAPCSRRELGRVVLDPEARLARDALAEIARFALRG